MGFDVTVLWNIFRVLLSDDISRKIFQKITSVDENTGDDRL